MLIWIALAEFTVVVHGLDNTFICSFKRHTGFHSDTTSIKIPKINYNQKVKMGPASAAGQQIIVLQGRLLHHYPLDFVTYKTYSATPNHQHIILPMANHYLQHQHPLKVQAPPVPVGRRAASL